MQLTEKFLYHIWDAQHLVEDLQTVSRKKLKVLFPGRWNTDAGPDFKDAIIQIGKKVLRGDIEIELATYNWKLHEHHENPAFNDVILQVVYQHNDQYEFNFNENGEQFEILQLANFLNQDIRKLAKKYSGQERKTITKKCKLLSKMQAEELKIFLTDLGNERFQKKIKRFAAEHYFVDFNQLCYQGIFESLGYSKNKYQMLQTAINIPYKKLQKFHQQGMTKDELIAILLCSTDLISHLPSSFPDEYKNKWLALYQNQSFFKNYIHVNWQLFRIRPANHPAVRIMQTAETIASSLDSSLFKDVLKLFSCSREKFNVNNLRKTLYDYFQTTPDFLPERYKLGRNRIDTIVINILLPLLMVFAAEKDFKDLKIVINFVYENFPGLPKNYITDFMESFLPDSLRKVLHKKAVYQQGILKLYFDRCKYHDCQECV